MTATMEESPAAAPPSSAATAPKKSLIPSAISLGSCIGGVPIKLHLSFFFLLLLEFFSSIRLSGDFPLYMLFVVVLYGPVLMLTVLIHEFGHIFATRRYGGEVGGIVLWVSMYECTIYTCTQSLSRFISISHNVHPNYPLHISPLVDSLSADQPIASQKKSR